jgi:hypothetical protein
MYHEKSLDKTLQLLITFWIHCFNKTNLTEHKCMALSVFAVFCNIAKQRNCQKNGRTWTRNWLLGRTWTRNWLLGRKL